ncbi:MAG: hypothetical protein B7X08_03185 [Acidocella sp. 20-63-7]|nr:MAG: hypothetical protein B7X08_03185 [Acidocella sp. 20-63-7]
MLRKTIRKYFLSDGVELQFTLPDRPSKLDPLANKLLGWPRQGVWKLRKQKRTTKQLHAALVALDNDGSYRRVVAFVCCGKADLQREQQSISRGAFVPLAFAAA